jgi:hypothetical protein
MGVRIDNAHQFLAFPTEREVPDENELGGPKEKPKAL